MTLIRRTSYPTLSDFLENLWDERRMGTGTTDMSMPAVNVSETSDEFKIDVAAPGFKKEDINVNVENNVLTISSEKQTEDKQDGETVSRREFRYGAFQRSFTLPNSANTDNINAKYDSGVLKITIPKREEAKAKPPRRIDIS